MKWKKLRKEHLRIRALNQRQILIDQNIREKYVRCEEEAKGEITLKHQGDKTSFESVLAMQVMYDIYTDKVPKDWGLEGSC